jgi:thiosulfate reductase cytochrome b subunit
VRSSELQQGQKLLGWGLVLVGLTLLMLVGLAQALVDRYSLPWLQSFVSWAPGAWWNRTCVGIVAWLLLAGGYVFLVSAHVDEHLCRMESQMAERLDRLTREVACLKRGQVERSLATSMPPSPGTTAGNPVAAP